MTRNYSIVLLHRDRDIRGRPFRARERGKKDNVVVRADGDIISRATLPLLAMYTYYNLIVSVLYIKTTRVYELFT